MLVYADQCRSVQGEEDVNGLVTYREDLQVEGRSTIRRNADVVETLSFTPVRIRTIRERDAAPAASPAAVFPPVPFTRTPCTATSTVVVARPRVAAWPCAGTTPAVNHNWGWTV